MQWARLKMHAGVPLRRGAWYRVVPPLSRLEVVVSVPSLEDLFVRLVAPTGERAEAARD